MLLLFSLTLKWGFLLYLFCIITSHSSCSQHKRICGFSLSEPATDLSAEARKKWLPSTMDVTDFLPPWKTEKSVITSNRREFMILTFPGTYEIKPEEEKSKTQVTSFLLKIYGIPSIMHLLSWWTFSIMYMSRVHKSIAKCSYKSLYPLMVAEPHFHNPRGHDRVWLRCAFSEVRSIIHSPDRRVVLRFLDSKLKEFFGSSIPAT